MMTREDRCPLSVLAAVAAVAIAVVLPGLANGYAFDDLPLLVEDPRVHDLTTLPGRLLAPWWTTGLYRPVSLGFLGTEWVVGAGSPLVFRIVSTILYAFVAMAVYRLASRAGAGPAWSALAGLLFAVHPVHAEVTANVVGQAELLAAIFGVAAVLRYLTIRRRPHPPSLPDALGVTGLAVLAMNAKESGYVTPLLILAAEVFLVRDGRAWRARWPELRLGMLALAAATLLSLLVRTRVLGALGGETPHPSLVGLSFGERGVAMLAMIPEWARLLLWPVRLQAEYGPPGLVPLPMVGPAHLGGAALLAVTLLGIWFARRRQPLVAFGLAWTVIAILPVANLLAPTGLLLAERTMFLPSVGVVLAMAGMAEAVWAGLRAAPAIRRLGMVGIAALLLVAGAHSARRQPVWRDTLTLFEHTVRDAPDSYRAQFLLARELQRLGRLEEAESAYRRSIALWQGEPRPFEELGQLLRVRGDCAGAIPVLEGGLRADSTSDVARSRLIECLIVERRWDAAEREIARGLAQGVESYRLAARRVNSGRVPPGNL